MLITNQIQVQKHPAGLTQGEIPGKQSAGTSSLQTEAGHICSTQAFVPSCTGMMLILS